MRPSPRWQYAAAAYQFLGTAQGQWGLRHGCGLALWEHVAEFSSYPSRAEIQRIYETVGRNQARYDEGTLIPALRKLWQSRMARESQLAAQYLNSSAAA